MNEIDLFDGHCDTISACYSRGGSLRRRPGGHLDLERGRGYRSYAQFFALFADRAEHRDLRGQFLGQYSLLRRELEENGDLLSLCTTADQAQSAFGAGRAAAFLSVEGGELLECSLERLGEAHALGVRAVNLTWNHANALSGSNQEAAERGLTGQGRAFVRRMEVLGMLVDVSHLSDRGFWDVAELLSGPFIASHSDARGVFFHPRNLTDGQFTAIIDHNGVAGLNLYASFLGEGADLDTVVAHLEHFLALGGARNVALGADFDGCPALPRGISGLQDMERLWERLYKRNYGGALLRALFFENLMRVVREVCTT